MARMNKKKAKARFKKLEPKVRGMLEEGKGPWQIGKELNIHHSTIQGWIKKIRQDDGDDDISDISKNIPKMSTRPPRKGSHFTQDDKGMASASLTDTKIRTLEDLIEVCQIDTETWECVHFDVKCWEMGRKAKRTEMEFVDGVASGYTQDTGKIFVQPLYSVVARFRRRREKTSEELADHFRELIGKIKMPTWTYKKHYVDAENTLELMVPDLHLGQISWSPETRGDDYNIEIACELLKASVRGMINEAGPRIKKIAFPIGNDFFNIDSHLKTTTRGTPQDEDGRWQHSFRVGCRTMMDIIGELSTRFEVDVMVVPGNHDVQRSFYMGEVLAAFFHDNERVSIDNSPHNRKYRLYGCTLVGYTHGDQESPKDLPMLMAHQEPHLWSKSLYREWHHGHLHHEKNNEVGGIKLRHFPALVPPDAWHSKKGYVMSVRQACAIEYSEDGPIRQYNWYPAMERKKLDG
jgi:hypothetical protein